MAPTLYSANLSELAKPVKSRKSKAKDTNSVEAPEVEVKIEQEAPQETPQEPKKKERSEKQLAAFEKAKETRRLKKEATDKAKAEANLLKQQQEEAEAAALQAKEEKKMVLKEKRRLSREAKKDPEEPPAKKTRTVKTQTPDEPPSWFKSYIMGVNTEKSKTAEEKKPQRQLRYESNAQAQTHWKEPLTRNRVTSEVDNHMNKMYSMIFSNRQV
jgi:hypothetical protein